MTTQTTVNKQYELIIDNADGFRYESFNSASEVVKRVLEVGQRAVIGYSNNCDDGWILAPWNYSLSDEQEEAKTHDETAENFYCGQIITVDSQLYVVVEYQPILEIAKKYPSIANKLSEAKIKGRLVLRKAKGKLLYHCHFTNENNFRKPFKAS